LLSFNISSFLSCFLSNLSSYLLVFNLFTSLFLLSFVPIFFHSFVSFFYRSNFRISRTLSDKGPENVKNITSIKIKLKRREII
jgi:hypothetical protein